MIDLFNEERANKTANLFMYLTSKQCPAWAKDSMRDVLMVVIIMLRGEATRAFLKKMWTGKTPLTTRLQKLLENGVIKATNGKWSNENSYYVDESLVENGIYNLTFPRENLYIFSNAVMNLPRYLEGINSYNEIALILESALKVKRDTGLVTLNKDTIQSFGCLKGGSSSALCIRNALVKKGILRCITKATPTRKPQFALNKKAYLLGAK